MADLERVIPVIDSVNKEGDAVQNQEPHKTQSSPISDDSNRCSFLELPVPIIFKVLTYLPAKDIICNVGLVCPYLAEIVNDKQLWVYRNSTLSKNRFPVVRSKKLTDSVEFWRKAALLREEESEKWKSCKFSKCTLPEVHYAGLDSIWMNTESTLLATGGRDRQIVITKIHERKHVQTLSGHNGWVWSLESTKSDEYLVSGSWDHSLRYWNIENGRCESIYSSGSPVLSLSCFNHDDPVMFYSTYHRNVGVVDFRIPEIPVQSLLSDKYHRKAILAVQCYGDYHLITGSEDCLVKLIDIRTRQVVKKIKLPSMVLSMHYKDGHLVVACKDQKLYFLDPEEMSICGIVEPEHEKKMTCVSYCSGCIITGSADCTVKVWEPTENARCLATLNDMSNCVTGLCYKNGILAVVGDNCKTILYIPDGHSAAD